MTPTYKAQQEEWTVIWTKKVCDSHTQPHTRTPYWLNNLHNLISGAADPTSAVIHNITKTLGKVAESHPNVGKRVSSGGRTQAPLASPLFPTYALKIMRTVSYTYGKGVCLTHFCFSIPYHKIQNCSRNSRLHWLCMSLKSS